MAEESAKVPKARLSQIAARKLSAFGISHRLRPDGETLEGELPFSGGVAHPATGEPLAGAPFVVIGHDRLGFTEPPLAGLGPIPYYDAAGLAALEQRVAQVLAQRLAALKAVSERMKFFRTEPQLDLERLVVQGQMHTTTHRFELLGGPEGVRVARVATLLGKPVDVARAHGALALDTFPTPADLEIHLSNSAAGWLESVPPRATPNPAAAATGDVQLVPPSAQALTAAALHRFGDGVVVTYGSKLELLQELLVDGARYRFTAVHERATTFSCKLVGPTGERWADKVDALRFPGIPALVATVLHLGTAPAASKAAAPAPAAPSVPDHLAPHPGEVWVMNVLIEQEGQGEVRYVGTDTDGRPYGAPRILKRPDFESVFAQTPGGWRLRIRIEGVQGDTVTYQQLDPVGTPRGAPRTIAAPVLVNTFVPESAAD